MGLDVSILVFSGCTALAPIGPMDILLTAGRLHAEAAHHEEPFFRVRLVSLGPNPVVTSNGFPVQCHATIAELETTGLVIVPALDGNVEELLARNAAAIPWVRKMFEAGADVASICTGAFVLAEAGLLDGRTATTHWVAQEAFARRYPRVRMAPDQVVVDNGRVCTSGGATSFLTLAAYLVEKYCGRPTARTVAKIFLIDVNKGPQSAYAIFSSQKAHGDDAVRAAQELMEGGADVKIGELARTVAMSPRTFVRRFKAATGNTPLEYLQRVRIEKAKNALEQGGDSVEQVAASAGYEDPGSFRSIFRRVTGVSPIEYRRRSRLYQA